MNLMTGFEKEDFSFAPTLFSRWFRKLFQASEVFACKVILIVVYRSSMSQSVKWCNIVQAVYANVSTKILSDCQSFHQSHWLKFGWSSWCKPKLFCAFYSLILQKPWQVFSADFAQDLATGCGYCHAFFDKWMSFEFRFGDQCCFGPF